MAPFGGKPAVGAHVLPTAVVVGGVVGAAVVIVVLLPGVLQSQIWPAPQGQAPAGNKSQALSHFASFPPKASAPLDLHAAMVVELSMEVVVVVVMGIEVAVVVLLRMEVVVVVVLVEEDEAVVVNVVLCTALVLGSVVVPSAGRTVRSAQLRNCSPHPQWTFPPQCPGQSPRTPQAAASYPLEFKTSA